MASSLSDLVDNLVKGTDKINANLEMTIKHVKKMELTYKGLRVLA